MREYVNEGGGVVGGMEWEGLMYRGERDEGGIE